MLAFVPVGACAIGPVDNPEVIFLTRSLQLFNLQMQLLSLQVSDLRRQQDNIRLPMIFLGIGFAYTALGFAIFYSGYQDCEYLKSLRIDRLKNKKHADNFSTTRSCNFKRTAATVEVPVGSNL